MLTLNSTGLNTIERMQFFSGQRLYASGLQSIEIFNREMRWIHNRRLHQPGIGSGFAVRGEIGDREVEIQPGYAIDSKGREIVLTKTKVLPVPPVAGGGNSNSAFYDLTVSYPEEIKLEEVETRQGVCLKRGTVRLCEEPNFCWVELDPDKKEPIGDLGDEIREGLRITIVRTEIQKCRLSKKISIAQRQNAKPSKGPNIVSGTYFPNPTQTEWVLWTNQNHPIGLTISINTSFANFTNPPDYYVEISGQRYVDENVDPNLDPYKVHPYLLDGFLNVDIKKLNEIPSPSTTGFKLYILMPQRMKLKSFKINPPAFFNEYTNSERQLILHRLRWSIKWFAVEG